MSFFALLAALLLGYYWPLARPDWLKRVYTPCVHLLDRSLNDGQSRHGVIAWLLGVLLPVVVVGVVYELLLHNNLLIGMLFSIGILTITLRFNRFGKQAEAIAAALRDSNVDTARTHLAGWEAGCGAEAFSAAEISRVGIEATLRNAHYDLFAPIFWFVLLGPAGALMYRLALLTFNEWKEQPAPDFKLFANRIFGWLDWLPARLTAGGFAVVGDFEDAVYCWRTQARTWPDRALGVILASGAGALGVRLGEPLPCKGVLQYRPALGMDDEADADYLMSAVGLIWRLLVLLIGLLLLLTFTHWIGI
jgi:adenosylcobinamide-phosphate synthase